MQFKIVGNPLKNRFWRWLNALSAKKIKKTDDDIINVVKVTFPSSFCILIRYEIINHSEKYEIVMQGDYQEKFRAFKDSDDDSLGGLDENEVEILIRTNHKRAKKIFSSNKN